MADIPQTVGRKQHSDSQTNMLHYNANRRLVPGLGSSLSRLEDRGTLEQTREISSHQSFGTQHGLLRHSVIYEHLFTNRESHSPTNGQLNGGSLHQETRRNQIKPTNSNSLGHMEPVSIMDYNPVCTTPFRILEYRSGCRIETSERQTRMGVGQTTVCQRPETLLHTPSRCIPSVHVSRRPDPRAIVVDAFSLNWS